ncbi:MAG: hypothetical protein AMJ84_07335 [Acidithiobacillales bacterium SM23_46]|jgi:hypothetical protein|nr:MAG: hypothetical protein AMJ84_07335 [Acidithiobacillales bacterium SM23_46]KPL28585.1 MAG: hypothetical protein AMJ72_02620 [Acidithiobacillales bacterium SM1_46]
MKRTPHWLVRRSTIRLLWIAFATVLAATVAAETIGDLHGHFGVDASPGFSAWFGFGACVAMILLAKLLGLILKRPDGYYDNRDP